MPSQCACRLFIRPAQQHAAAQSVQGLSRCTRTSWHTLGTQQGVLFDGSGRGPVLLTTLRQSMRSLRIRRAAYAQISGHTGTRRVCRSCWVLFLSQSFVHIMSGHSDSRACVIQGPRSDWVVVCTLLGITQNQCREKRCDRSDCSQSPSCPCMWKSNTKGMKPIVTSTATKSSASQRHLVKLTAVS